MDDLLRRQVGENEFGSLASCHPFQASLCNKPLVETTELSTTTIDHSLFSFCNGFTEGDKVDVDLHNEPLAAFVSDRFTDCLARSLDDLCSSDDTSTLSSYPMISGECIELASDLTVAIETWKQTMAASKSDAKSHLLQPPAKRPRLQRVKTRGNAYHIKPVVMHIHNQQSSDKDRSKVSNNNNTNTNNTNNNNNPFKSAKDQYQEEGGCTFDYIPSQTF